MKKLYFIALLFLLFVSEAAAQVRYQETQARTIEPRTGMVTTPMVAELEILNDGVKYSQTIDNGVVVSSNILSMINEYKNQALAKLLNDIGADVMFGTLYEIVTNERNTLSIKITGYPAKFSKIRMAKPEDAWMTNIYYIVDRNQSASPVNDIKQQTLINPSLNSLINR